MFSVAMRGNVLKAGGWDGVCVRGGLAWHGTLPQPAEEVHDEVQGNRPHPSEKKIFKGITIADRRPSKSRSHTESSRSRNPKK